MIIEKPGDVKLLERFFNRIVVDLNKFAVVKSETLFPAEIKETNEDIFDFSTLEGRWKKLDRFHLFKENQKYYWIRKEIVLPEKRLRRSKYFLQFKCGDITEELLFINRKPISGISTVLWDDGKPFSLPDDLKEGEKIEILLNVFTGDTSESFVGEKPQLLSEFSLLEIDYEAWELYNGFSTALDAAIAMGKDKSNYHKIMRVLEEVWKEVDFSDRERYRETVPKALENLKKNLYNGKKQKDIRTGVFGHAHLDVAWLWTLKETEDKAVRMFATQLNLIKKYKGWIFQQGQAQLYRYIQKKAPGIYEEVKEAVKRGRWEPSGANWVEFDTNMSGGESIIRQIMYGKEFFKKEFGNDNRVLWLPDVFGYSAALPQILRKADIDLFITTKISWNDTTRFPYDTFYWEGIDGSKILTHFVTTPWGKAFHTYNTKGRAKEVWETYLDYTQKDINSEMIMPFGYGDGGGGPKEEMVKRIEFLEKGLEGFIKVEYMGLEKYRKILHKSVKNKEVPLWNGELYLEFHRGVYTTQANVKRNNRKSELLLRLIDILLLLSVKEDVYFEEIKELWKVVLLNQFHDILPGSSIKEVYEVSKQQFEKLYIKAAEIKNSIIKEIIEPDKNYITVFNPYSWKYRGYVKAGKDMYVYLENIPAMSFKSISTDNIGDGGLLREYKAENNIIIENNYYRFKLNSKTGNIKDLYLKSENKYINEKNKELNIFEIYEDKSISDFESAWDLEYMHQYKKYAETGDLLEPITVREWGNRKEILIKKKILHSEIEQKIIVFEKDPVIHFQTRIDWQEEDCVLKVNFPVSVHESEATYNIQFGTIQRPTYRNTVYEHTKFEVPAHKWIDLSESDYGVSLITDSKYGYSVKDNEMRITLLRAPINPDKEADRGIHYFEYGLYAHKGEWFKSDVYKEAYQLNFPGVVINGKIKDTELSKSMIELKCADRTKGDDTLIVETIKRAENSKGVVVRLYESKDSKGVAEIKFQLPGKKFKKVYECNLLEEKKRVITENYKTDKGIKIKYKPYEIITLLFE